MKVTTGNADLAKAALGAHPYAVVEWSHGEHRAIVCVGTECLAPVSEPSAVGEAVARTAAVA